MDTPTFKGTGIDFLRKQARERDVEPALLAALDEDAREVYSSALAVSWIDVDAAARVYAAAARILYPASSEPLVDLGRAMAHYDLTGVYKILLRVATVPMAIARTARLWSTYHKKGSAHAEREGDAKKADLVVEGYPDLPEAIRVNICGYVQGVLDLTGSKNPRVSHARSSPQVWRWHVTWE